MSKDVFLSASSFCILHSSELDFIRTFFIWNGLDFISTFSIWNGLDFISTFFIWNGLDLTSTFFIRDGLDWTWLAHFSLEMGFTLLSDCSFQIGLDSSDFSCLFQAQETKGGTKCTELGSFSRRSTKYPVLLSFSTLSIKQNRLAVAERNLMEFVKPAVSCPIECNRLLVCVRISCGFRRACPRATASRLSARSGVRMARALWQQACPLASCKQFSRELLQADCSCLALRRRPPPAAAATAPGTVACSGSSGPGGLQR